MADEWESSTRPTRRGILQTMALAGLAPLVPSTASAQGATSGGNILIAYYSRTGNTREVANQIHRKLGGDLFELRTVEPYPQEYRATTDQAKREQEASFRPTLENRVENMGRYDTVFLGYPNWWATIAMPMFTFLEAYDFSGKTLVPFCTHEGSRLGRSVSDIQAICPDAKLLEGLALRGASDGSIRTATSEADVLDWLGEIGLAG